MKQKRVMGIILAVLIIGAGYLFYVTRVCQIRVVTDPEYAGFRVSNPILWRIYLSSMMECRDGRVVVYKTMADDTVEQVLISDVRLVLERGDYDNEFRNEQEGLPIFTWQVDVDPSADEAIGFIAMRRAKLMSDEEIDKNGWIAVRHVLRTMLLPVPERAQEVTGSASWFSGLRRLGLEMKFR